MLITGRIVMLVVYVAIVAFAIRRSPRGRWALCAVALIPVAVFQSASSLSPDAFTNAVALLVVSSALRALDPPAHTTAKQLVVEAALLSALLGMCKPAYVVVAGCYLLPLIGPRERRARLWAARAGRSGWRGRDVRVERDRRRSLAHGCHVLRDPARSAGTQARPVHRAVALRRRRACAPFPIRSGDWMRGLWGVGPSVTDSRDIVICGGGRDLRDRVDPARRATSRRRSVGCSVACCSWCSWWVWRSCSPRSGSTGPPRAVTSSPASRRATSCRFSCSSR